MVGKALGVIDWIQGFLYGVASLAVAAALYFKPEWFDDGTINETWRLGFAGFFGVFGALMVPALLFSLGKGRFARAVASRFKGMLLLFVASVVLTLVGYSVSGPAVNAWRLAEDGVGAEAVIERKDFKIRNGNPTYEYIVAFDGHHKRLKRLEGHPGVGGSVFVLYLPDDPTVAMVGTPGDSAFSILKREASSGALWGALGVFVIFGFIGLYGLHGIVFGHIGNEDRVKHPQ